jgi:hypothetical protein
MSDKSKSTLHEKAAMSAAAALLVATTVGAIAAYSKTSAVTPQLWKQTPNFVLSLPGGYGVEDALY